MLHVRPLVPAVPEMVPEDQIEYVQLFDDKGKPLDEWIHADPETQKLVKGPKPKTKKLVPTGSMKAADLVCHDCGTGLLGAHGGHGFYFMVCGRIDSRDERFIHLAKKNEKGELVQVIEQVPDAPKPKADTVVECGRYGLEDAQ